jgi:hypothetical protein
MCRQRIANVMFRLSEVAVVRRLAAVAELNRVAGRLVRRLVVVPALVCELLEFGCGRLPAPEDGARNS